VQDFPAGKATWPVTRSEVIKVTRVEAGVRAILLTQAPAGGEFVLGHVGVRNGAFVWIPGDYTTRMSVDAVTGQPK
jgi:hypothetical protein